MRGNVSKKQLRQFGLLLGFVFPVIIGCKDDNTAFNYVPPIGDSSIDVNTNIPNGESGSCYPVVLGCSDFAAFNFNDYDRDGFPNAITGIDGVDTQERTDAFRTYIEQLGTGATVEWSTEDHATVISRILEIREGFVEEFYAPSVERRKDLINQFHSGDLSEDDLPRDLLTLMYLHWNNNWDDELPLREATLYLVASSQTTTHAIPHLMIHLHEWFQEHPEDYEKRFNREFLKRAGHEAIRLHLPSPALLRIALRDVVLSSGVKILEGERVACLFTPANRDVKVFGEDARKFNPYRETQNVKPWGFAFGGGEHTCIGRTLVTGLSARTDNDDGTDGTLVNIAHALFNAGIELDPDDLPTYTELSHHDAYGRFPIILRNL